MESRKLRFAVLGCGFWSRFQIAAWREIDGVELVAVYNRTIDKARKTAEEFNVPGYYNDINKLFENEKIDFVDIITDVDTHFQFVQMAFKRRIAVICQKPLTADLASARQLVSESNEANIPFFIHENFRWQAPIQRLKKAMDTNVVGKIFKARVSFCSAFPVFENQPALAISERFILMDIGTHILDVVRFLFGEAKTIFCLTKTVNSKICGEDVANALLEMHSGVHCYAEMSYASVLEKEVFPQTLVLIEGEHGSIELAADFNFKITTRERTTCETVTPRSYSWADPAYAVSHSSIVDINRNFRDALMSGVQAATSAADNLKTLQLVFAAYDSAASGEVIKLK
ncbi:Gfo/Idh/MocA family protein [Dyadobacter bucti]|uniref:Gfo/Idh/MocA family protein n=1 Tax=Dyadobacter bucti TaxID=2572203 RepID=UPI001108B1AB|nr:Gfo/Idh/MocA family oxidoreductase [Dyadobacter bucti]